MLDTRVMIFSHSRGVLEYTIAISLVDIFLTNCTCPCISNIYHVPTQVLP